MAEPEEPVEDTSGYGGSQQFVDGAQAERDMRVREQCYLVRNMNRYARSRMLGYEKKIMPDGKSTASGASYNTAGLGVAQTFKNLVLTNADPGFVVSSLAGTSDAAALLNIPSNVLSRLVPHIQLYKVFYDRIGKEKNKVLGSEGEVVYLPFPNNYGPGLAEDLLKNKAGQGDGIGLKSLSVNFMGTNPAEVKTILDVKLKIYARDFVELAKVRNSKKSTKNGLWYPASFADLITRDVNRKFESDREVVEDAFRIRAVVGWSVPQNSAGSIFEGVPDAQSIKNTLQNTKMILNLSLKGHSLNFNQDGSVILDCNYIGELEGEMRDPQRSVFYYNQRKISAQSDIVLNSLKALNTARQAERAANGGKLHDTYAVDFNGDPSATAALEDYLDGPEATARREAERAYENAVNLSKQIESEELGYAYKTFLEGFFTERKHSIFWAEIPPQIFRQSIDPRVPKPEYGGANVLVERLGPKKFDKLSGLAAGNNVNISVKESTTNKEINVYQLHGYAQQGEVWASSTMGGAGSGRMKQAVDDAFSMLANEEGKSYDDMMSALNKNLSDIGDDRYTTGEQEGPPVPTEQQYNLYFTYLGDIIDYAMNSIRDTDVNATGENLKILLGAFTFIDPLTFETRKVNISDIPIGIPTFLDWLFQNYVRKEKFEVSPFQFMRDIVQALGINFLGTKCFSAGSTPVTRTRFGMQMALSVPRVNGRTVLKEGNGLQSKHLNKIAAIKQDPSFQNLPPEEIDKVCYIYVTNTLPIDKSGIEKEDAKQGIFHFRLGADRGMLKKAKYKRMDVKYMEEARIVENDKIDDSKRNPDARPSTSTVRLKEVYNCDIEMFGNTIFYPGMVFYIDPSKMGLEGTAASTRGSLKLSLAESLGIKGYYHVNKVEHIYESGKYETLLQGIFLTDGNSEFYKEKIMNQSSNVNRMLNMLSDPSSAAALRWKEAMFITNGPGGIPSENILTDPQQMSEDEKEITTGEAADK